MPRFAGLVAVCIAALLTMLLVAGALAQPVVASQLDVPLWSQHDSRWSSVHLDGSSYTMAGSGCAVTSCAMVAAYFGSDKNPGELCRALGANGGLDSQGRMYWERVPGAAGGTISYIGRWDYAYLARINQEVDAGYPVIAEVRLHGASHFVVITGREGSTYHINDPGFGDRTTVNARYGNPGTVIHGIRIYHGQSSSPESKLGPPDPNRIFADVPATNPYCAAIEELAQDGVMSGYILPDGSSRFQPSQPVLRAQTAKLMCGIFELGADESLESTFADLGPDLPESLYPHDYVAAAVTAGIIQGRSPEVFDPWSRVSRAQFVTMHVRSAENLQLGLLASPPDDFSGLVNHSDPVHGANLRMAEYNGLLDGLIGLGRDWDPWAPCARGEAAQMLHDWELRSARLEVGWIYEARPQCPSEAFTGVLENLTVEHFSCLL
ncbi:MAG: S-layer homology domain-containing protein [Actinobacteria bacterium]|nr:S-layer homology domain-containing protein [Actinomycetota bacterium]